MGRRLEMQDCHHYEKADPEPCANEHCDRLAECELRRAKQRIAELEAMVEEDEYDTLKYTLQQERKRAEAAEAKVKDLTARLAEKCRQVHELDARLHELGAVE